MRVSDSIKQFNVEIRPAVGKPGETIYRVKDLFTTRDGSWEPSNRPGSVPQWARDTYLKPPSHPQYNDDAGADHHIFGAIAHGDKLQPHGNIRYWTYNDNANHAEQRVKLHGWGNIVMWDSSSFVPERGERGPWAWQPAGVNADVVIGAGMPAKWHVSFFCVWEPFVVPGVIPPPVDPVDPPPTNTDDTALVQRVAMLEAQMRQAAAMLQKQAAQLLEWSAGK